MEKPSGASGGRPSGSALIMSPSLCGPAGVGGAEEEEDCPVKCLTDLVIRGVDLKQELAGLVAVRALHLSHGGQVLQVQPGGSTSNLGGEISRLNLPGLVVSLHETEIYVGRGHL